jgi:UDP-N-acetylglucosamine 3-dehydrogenase
MEKSLYGMVPMSRINIAVIGAGYWGKKVISELLSVPRDGYDIALHSVVDSSPMALEQCRREFGQIDCRLDYRELLTDPRVSGVHIASPNNTHFKLASEFIRNGKHVLVEKPLALKSVDAFELVRLAREYGRVLCTGHVHRFNNGVRALRRLMASGVLGDLYYLKLRWTGLMALQANREVITDLGPHPFDISNNLLDTWPSKVSCRGRGFRATAGYEMADIYAEHPNRLDASIELSWLDIEKHRDVSVVGSEGAARLDCLDQRLILQRRDSTEPVMVFPNNTLKEEIVHFASCIEHNASYEPYPNIASGAIGASVVRLVESSKRSLEEDRAVRVEIPRIEESPMGRQEMDLRQERGIRSSR